MANKLPLGWQSAISTCPKLSFIHYTLYVNISANIETKTFTLATPRLQGTAFLHIEHEGLGAQIMPLSCLLKGI